MAMKTPDCSVCDYVGTFLPDRGFIAFRADLPRVGIDALKAVCEHLGGRGCTFGLQLRDQFVNLLWENCLAATKTEQSIVTTQANNHSGNTVNPATPLERENPKKQKTDDSSIIVTVESVQVDQPLQKDNQETQASVTKLSEEIKRLQSENQKFAESQQQLIQNQQQLARKCAELLEIVQRLQCRQDISDRLLCTVYDQQRSLGDSNPSDFFSLIHSFLDRLNGPKMINNRAQRCSLVMSSEQYNAYQSTKTPGRNLHQSVWCSE